MAWAGRRQAGSPYAPYIHWAEHVRGCRLLPRQDRQLLPGLCPAPAIGAHSRPSWAARVKRGSGAVPPQARSAAISPTSGANLAPWPEQGEQITNGPCRSRMKSSLAVEVYRLDEGRPRSGPDRGEVERLLLGHDQGRQLDLPAEQRLQPRSGGEDHHGRAPRPFRRVYGGSGLVRLDAQRPRAVVNLRAARDRDSVPMGLP